MQAAGYLDQRHRAVALECVQQPQVELVYFQPAMKSLYAVL
jgi:hypothetical protein